MLVGRGRCSLMRLEPTAPTASPIVGATLLMIDPRPGVRSRSINAEPRALIAAPVATPCTTRAMSRMVKPSAEANSASETASSASAPSRTGRLPM